MKLQKLITNILMSIFLLQAFSMFANIAGTAQKPQQSYSMVDDVINKLMHQANLPGLSIAVSRKGEIIYKEAFGYSNLKEKKEMTTTTRLRTASVAKVITATAIARLVSEGVLDLDAPIKNYVPYIDTKYAELTCRQLSGHTSGLSHRPTAKNYKSRKYNSTKETVEIINAPLLFEPDTKYEYSTNAFNILAAVIEGISGKKYSSFMSEDIFDPLGMTHTAAENINELTANDAKLYFIKKGKLKSEKKLTSGAYKIPGAGFRSTATDLVLMMNAYSNGFIKEETVREMFRGHKLKDGESTNVGITWRRSYDAFGNEAYDHAGSWAGARSVIVHYPKQDLNISIMINARCNFFIEETAHIIAQFFLNSQTPSNTIQNLEEKVQIKFNNPQGSQNTKEVYSGKLIIQNNEGQLSADTDGLLKNNPLIYLGRNNYSIISKYGLLYLHLETQNGIKGKVHIYANRNPQNPTEINEATFEIY